MDSAAGLAHAGAGFQERNFTGGQATVWTNSSHKAQRDQPPERNVLLR